MFHMWWRWKNSNTYQWRFICYPSVQELHGTVKSTFGHSHLLGCDVAVASEDNYPKFQRISAFIVEVKKTNWC
jgi:hypothetical protein